jgi:hypothetical protein
MIREAIREVQNEVALRRMIWRGHVTPREIWDLEFGGKSPIPEERLTAYHFLDEPIPVRFTPLSGSFGRYLNDKKSIEFSNKLRRKHPFEMKDPMARGHNLSNVAGHEFVHGVHAKHKDSVLVPIGMESTNNMEHHFGKKLSQILSSVGPNKIASGKGDFIYLLNNCEMPARLHTIAAEGFRRAGKIPESRIELYALMATSGMIAPPEVRRVLLETEEGQTACKVFGTIGEHIHPRAREIAGQVKRLTTDQQTLFWTEAAPAFYAELRTIYGDRNGYESMGFQAGDPEGARAFLKAVREHASDPFKPICDWSLLAQDVHPDYATKVMFESVKMDLDASTAIALHHRQTIERRENVGLPGPIMVATSDLSGSLLSTLLKAGFDPHEKWLPDPNGPPISVASVVANAAMKSGSASEREQYSRFCMKLLEKGTQLDEDFLKEQAENLGIGNIKDYIASCSDRAERCGSREMVPGARTGFSYNGYGRVTNGLMKMLGARMTLPNEIDSYLTTAEEIEKGENEYRLGIPRPRISRRAIMKRLEAFDLLAETLVGSVSTCNQIATTMRRKNIPLPPPSSEWPEWIREIIPDERLSGEKARKIRTTLNGVIYETSKFKRENIPFEVLSSKDSEKIENPLDQKVYRVLCGVQKNLIAIVKDVWPKTERAQESGPETARDHSLIRGAGTFYAEVFNNFVHIMKKTGQSARHLANPALLREDAARLAAALEPLREIYGELSLATPAPGIKTGENSPSLHNQVSASKDARHAARGLAR